ncbi:hypothetical protein [Solitalea lacus]|uniref:hypothetical protein n=1 Tax=Solitalea lacus TaxID=2911172 RepID=UPI001EDBD68B|nr:hypothetical protein [Solitalea lacus]UKJ06535.1 hypothetical protein L2B55_13450 [Solitalea lacus]
MNKFVSFSLLLVVVTISACTNSINKKPNTSTYFDLKEYFENEAKRLNRENPKVEKTVNDNGKQETKAVLNTIWLNELSVFINSNINKPAWSKSYSVTSTDSTEEYKALDSSLKTQFIKISKGKTGIDKIFIQNHTTNELYELDEKLYYESKKIYRIERVQKATMLKESTFSIVGKFL